MNLLVSVIVFPVLRSLPLIGPYWLYLQNTSSPRRKREPDIWPAGRDAVVAWGKQSINGAKTLQLCLLLHDTFPQFLVALFQIQDVLRCYIMLKLESKWLELERSGKDSPRLSRAGFATIWFLKYGRVSLKFV